MIKYMDLGGDKLLSSIVMAGSHDAGITEGKTNAKTQALTIGEQARAGSRLFDVRVAAFTGDNGQVEFKTFHGPKRDEIGFKKTLTTGGNQVQNAPKVKPRKMMAGTTGQDLQSIFDQARDFVTTTGEFLFLKFDKSDYPALIAEVARDVIGNQALYSGNGCLNEMQLRDLGGKVFVLIMSKDWSKLSLNEKVGTLPIYKLRDVEKGKLFWKKVTPAAYTPHRPGLQYVGQGGTSVAGFNISHKSTLKENVKKQTKRLQKLKDVAGTVRDHQFVMGMMYWTATGTFRNIEKRNDYMWKNDDQIEDLWKSGVGTWIAERLPPNVTALTDEGYSAGGLMKACMPNFVMIDFADKQKCKAIYKLNTLSTVQMVQYF